MRNIKVLLFDIDSTLLYTGGAGRIAIERCFEELFGIPHCWQGLIPDGKTDPLIFEELSQRTLNRLLSDDELKLLHDKYAEYFETEIKICARFKIMPGADECLKKLHDQSRFLMGLQTGNFETTAWLKLKKANFDSYFTFGGFGSDGRTRVELLKQALVRAEKILGTPLEENQILAIGDARQDIEAAQELGILTAAVATGRTPKDHLRALNPSFLLDNLQEAENQLPFLFN